MYFLDSINVMKNIFLCEGKCREILEPPRLNFYNISLLKCDICIY